MAAPDWIGITRELMTGYVARPRVEVLDSTREHAVLRVDAPGTRHVLKLARSDARPAVDYARTASAHRLAEAAGVPVAAVVAVGDDGVLQHLLQEHVEGVDWRHVRPQLDAAEIETASTDIARAVLRIQSVTLPSWGSLDDPGGRTLLDALHDRIALRTRREDRRALAQAVLDRHADLFAEPVVPTLTHDDLHHANLLFRPHATGWRLAAVLDWDKAWAGPPESDVARMAFWDDMTDPVFWSVYRHDRPAADGWRERAAVYQLLWCLEYDMPTPRHQRDTAALLARLT
ncbi:aminoglycoside phosphotransferase family protein [Cellulomonas humilata]|uniref:Aminoglycoside phosphotransferase family protein n=1 Tax=Cellulomonas humilata TaxID=144055 RepID=A0A7Y6E005_9CELL|nr:aminoglycoside phosphotransferase family protein [Cellulomonas humilata]